MQIRPGASPHPRILSRTNHLAAQLHEFSAANNSERNVGIHGIVDFLHGFIVSWEMVDLDTVRLQFLVNFCLQKKIENRYTKTIQ